MMSLGKIGLPSRGVPAGAARLANTCRFQLCRLLMAWVSSRSGNSRLAMVSQVSVAVGKIDFLTLSIARHQIVQAKS